MILQFAERLKKRRLDRGMTQEELARAIMISPQSVSKWERGDGYPDITLLPRIANYFNTTIDALLGNDDVSKDLDEDNCWKSVHEADLSSNYEDYEKGLKIAIEYYNKYPNNYSYMYEIACRVPLIPSAKREKYFSIMRECCESLLHSTFLGYREKAIESMCMVCDDSEFDRWHKLAPIDYGSISEEILEERLWFLGKHNKSQRLNQANNLILFLHLMFRCNRNRRIPEKSLEWNEYRIRLIEFFAQDGEIPEAWLGVYTYLHFAAACSSFSCGQNSKGYVYFEKVLELYPNWLSISDGTPMNVGNSSVFGNIKIIKDGFKMLYPDAETYPIMGYCHIFHSDIIGYKLMFNAMTAASGWECFDCVREESCFKEYINRLNSLVKTEDVNFDRVIHEWREWDVL